MSAKRQRGQQQQQTAATIDPEQKDALKKQLAATLVQNIRTEHVEDELRVRRRRKVRCPANQQLIDDAAALEEAVKKPDATTPAETIELFSGEEAIEYITRLHAEGRLFSLRGASANQSAPVQDIDRVLDELLYRKNVKRPQHYARQQEVQIDLKFECSIAQFSARANNCKVPFTKFVTPAQLLPKVPKHDATDDADEEDIRYDTNQIVVVSIDRLHNPDDPSNNSLPFTANVSTSIQHDAIQEMLAIDNLSQEEVDEIIESLPILPDGKINTNIDSIPSYRPEFPLDENQLRSEKTRLNILCPYYKSTPEFACKFGGLKPHNLSLGVYEDDDNHVILSSYHLMGRVVSLNTDFKKEFKRNVKRYDTSPSETRKIMRLDKDVFLLMLEHSIPFITQNTPFRVTQDITFNITPDYKQIEEYTFDTVRNVCELKTDKKVVYDLNEKHTVKATYFMRYIIFPDKSDAIPYHKVPVLVWNGSLEASTEKQLEELDADEKKEREQRSFIKDLALLRQGQVSVNGMINLGNLTLSATSSLTSTSAPPAKLPVRRSTRRAK
jgi:hypothetical protein